VAGFLELVSDNKISVALETETVDEILEGWAVQWGASRKIDDEDIEVDLAFRKLDQKPPTLLASSDADIAGQKTEDDVTMQEHQALEGMLDVIKDAGADGIMTEDLMVSRQTRFELESCAYLTFIPSRHLRRFLANRAPAKLWRWPSSSFKWVKSIVSDGPARVWSTIHTYEPGS
jgi:hypothetical protein